VTPHIAKLIAWLREHGVKEPGIFRESCSTKGRIDLEAVLHNRVGLEGALHRRADVHVVATVLKRIFRLSAAPTLDPATVRTLVESPNDDDAIRDVLQRRLVLQMRVDLAAVASLLKEVTRHKEVNKMSTMNLSICWTPALTQGTAACCEAIARIIDDGGATLFSTHTSGATVRRETSSYRPRSGTQPDPPTATPNLAQTLSTFNNLEADLTAHLSPTMRRLGASRRSRRRSSAPRRVSETDAPCSLCLYQAGTTWARLPPPTPGGDPIMRRACEDCAKDPLPVTNTNVVRNVPSLYDSL